MSDLKADTERIRECSDALKRVHDEFTTHGNPADRYTESELGSSLLTGAFDDFGSNWKIHRKQLAKELESLGKITEDAAKTYDAADHDLANALRALDKASTPKGGAQR